MKNSTPTTDIQMRIFANRKVGLFISKGQHHLVDLPRPWSMAIGVIDLDSSDLTDAILADSKYAYVESTLRENSEVWKLHGCNGDLHSLTTAQAIQILTKQSEPLENHG